MGQVGDDFGRLHPEAPAALSLFASKAGGGVSAWWRSKCLGRWGRRRRT